MLLALLPFWTPLIPPMGIASLKVFLQSRGFRVRTVDATIELCFKEIYDGYFRFLRSHIPVEKRGNFYNIGHDLQQNHFMAHMHKNEGGRGDEERYIGLLQELVYRIFYTRLERRRLVELDGIAGEFFRRLRTYVLDLLEEENPGVLGLTVHIHTLPASLYAFRLAKETDPHITTVMGGGIFTEQLAAGSPNLDFFLEKTPYIDKIIMGEGESLLLEFLEGELRGSPKVISPGLMGTKNLDISSKELPDLSDFFLDFYLCLSATGSVSCPFRCDFCSETVYFGQYVKKSPGQVYDEMVTLYQRYGKQLLIMTDSLLNPIITDLAREFTDPGTVVYWDGCLRVGSEVCDVKNALLWRRGGFYGAKLGIESGSRRVLDLMGKGINVEQSKAALRALAYAGIKTTTYWIIGYPGETEGDFLQTLAFIEELKDDIYEAESHPFQFLPGLANYDYWRSTAKIVPLYPVDSQDLLVIRTYIMDCYPPREEIYRRLNRFTARCRELGIPNSYSEEEIFAADERWKRLHKNAVPAMIEFKEKGTRIDECKWVSDVFRPTRKLDPDKQEDFRF